MQPRFAIATSLLNNGLIDTPTPRHACSPYTCCRPRSGLGFFGLGSTVTVTPQLQTLAQTIQTQEGFYPGSIAYQNNNPGNLIYVGQPGATQGAGGFASFDSYQDGLNALYGQLNLYATGACGACGGQPLTIQQMANIYAPAGQGSNNPTVYANNMAAALGVSPDTLLSTALSTGTPADSSLTTGDLATYSVPSTTDTSTVNVAGFDLTQTELYVGAAVVLGVFWLAVR